MHVSLVGFRPQVLSSNYPLIRQAFHSCRILTCCQAKDKEGLAALEGADVFSQEEADAALGYDGKRAGSIGHYRNLLQLASLSLEREAPLVLLDDDVVPQAGCMGAFSRAFSTYGMVQGKYEGSMGNGIYMLVRFLEFLEGWEETAENLRQAQTMLSGVVSRGREEAGVRGAVGGLLGISTPLLCANAFAPTSYPFDDHFYEFSSRHQFKGMKFMDGGTSEEDIPLAEHRAEPSGQGKLVSHYALYVKSAIVENYCCFRLSGAVPSPQAGGKLARMEKFDAEGMCGLILSQAAFGKIARAAQHYLDDGICEPIRSQLQRIARLSPKDFFVSPQELEAEWEAFEGEREWLSAMKKEIVGGKKNFFRSLWSK